MQIAKLRKGWDESGYKAGGFVMGLGFNSRAARFLLHSSQFLPPYSAPLAFEVASVGERLRGLWGLAIVWGSRAEPFLAHFISEQTLEHTAHSRRKKNKTFPFMRPLLARLVIVEGHFVVFYSVIIKATKADANGKNMQLQMTALVQRGSLVVSLQFLTMKWIHAVLAAQAFHSIPKTVLWNCAIFVQISDETNYPPPSSKKENSERLHHRYSECRWLVCKKLKKKKINKSVTNIPLQWNIQELTHFPLEILPSFLSTHAYVQDKTYLMDTICSGRAIKWLTRNFLQFLHTRWVCLMPALLMCVI